MRTPQKTMTGHFPTRTRPGHVHRLDDGARLTARRSRDASRGVVHVVRSECSHDAVIGGITGVKGLEEGLIGAGLPVSRSRMRNRCTVSMRLKTRPCPVYFVSHGGKAFPSLIVVLQGDGVRVDLVGTTFINKAGITSSTFKTVPDVPVKSFELYLPQGQHSALAANGNLCRAKAKLGMPTEFVAQNGVWGRPGSGKVAVSRRCGSVLTRRGR